jgi:hypothetical protein
MRSAYNSPGLSCIKSTFALLVVIKQNLESQSVPTEQRIKPSFIILFIAYKIVENDNGGQWSHQIS